MKKHYYMIVDTETTKAQTVADFGAVIMTRQGEIVEEYGVCVLDHFATLPLFCDPSAADAEIWSELSAQRREKNYHKMLHDGSRALASVTHINLWLAKVKGQYDPTLTAYQLSFDAGKCRNTGINLGIFGSRFCLMKAAKKVFFPLADYQEFCYDNNLLTKGGKYGKNKIASTTADTMAKYLLGIDLQDEPHTAVEDARDYEAVILTEILKTKTRNQLMELGL